MTLVPNETEQALNRQYDIYEAAREEYRKKIAEQAQEIEQMRAALEELSFDFQMCLTIGAQKDAENERLRAALEEIKLLGVQKKGSASYAMASIARAALATQPVKEIRHD